MVHITSLLAVVIALCATAASVSAAPHNTRRAIQDAPELEARSKGVAVMSLLKGGAKGISRGGGGGMSVKTFSPGAAKGVGRILSPVGRTGRAAGGPARGLGGLGRATAISRGGGGGARMKTFSPGPANGVGRIMSRGGTGRAAVRVATGKGARKFGKAMAQTAVETAVTQGMSQRDVDDLD
jgi:hypothetical protein